MAYPDTNQAPPIDLTGPLGWQRAVLRQLGAPDDPGTSAGGANIAFLNGWAQAEGTSAIYNPLATSLVLPGSSDFNSVGVQNYPTPAAGVDAMARTIAAGYPRIVAALRQGAPRSILTTANGKAELNKWVTGKLAQPGPDVANYIRSIEHGYWGTFGESKSASDWTSADLGTAAKAAKSAANAATSAAAGIASGIGGLAGSIAAIVRVLLDPNTWRRVGLGLLGVTMMLAGGFLLARGGALPSVAG